MPQDLNRLTPSEWKRCSGCPIKCPLLRERVASLADFMAVISNAMRTDELFWFRGHADVSCSLTPSALRFKSQSDREKALGLMADFRRIAEIKLPRPPSAESDLQWAQIAQHFGLPTRLLDWTESATAALYFACLKDNTDGVVLILNPTDLNRLSYPRKPRVLDPRKDEGVIRAYLRMGAKRTRSGRYPVAINPVWNSERLIMQKGVFTLHGGRFDLDGNGIPSLVAIPILREYKKKLRAQLQRIGIDEMTLFPELEHSCAHLKRRAGLEVENG
jgi:hypothetical protein